MAGSQNPSNNLFFSKVLPSFGHITNVLSILASGGITYMALRITMSSKEDSPSASTQALSVVGTSLHSLVTVIMYIYSDATETLAHLGKNMDQAVYSFRMNGYTPLNSANSSFHQTRCARKIVLSLVCCIVVTNVTIGSIGAYQQGILLVDEFLNLSSTMHESEREHKRLLLQWLIVNNFTFLGAYPILAFQGSFAIKLVDNFTKRNDDIQRPLLFQQGANNLLFSERRVTRTEGQNVTRNESSPISARPRLNSA